jgi:hypothetical protein
VGEVEVKPDGGDDGRIGGEREDPHLATTRRAQERKQLVDPPDEDGPAGARWREAPGGDDSVGSALVALFLFSLSSEVGREGVTFDGLLELVAEDLSEVLHGAGDELVRLVVEATASH